MDPPHNKNFKKLHKLFQHDISPRTPVNIATRPPGFQAELDIGPKGKQGRSYHHMTDWPDPTVMLDRRSTGASRIVFQDKDGVDQLRTPEVSALDDVAGSTKHEHFPTSEYF